MKSDPLYRETQTQDFRLVESDVEPVAPIDSLVAVDSLVPLASTGQVPDIALQAARAPAAAAPAVTDLAAPASRPHVFAADYFSSSAAHVAPDKSWGYFWEIRGRQMFNAVYLTIALCAVMLAGATSPFLQLPAVICAAVLILFIALALVYVWKYDHSSGSTELFSERTQKYLRRVGLIAPLLPILFAASNFMGRIADWQWHHGYYPGMADVMPNDRYLAAAKEFIHRADALSPFNTSLTKELFDDATGSGLNQQALALADKIVFFEPTDDRWKIRRYAVLGRMPERASEFEGLAASYEKRFGYDGFYWSKLADLAVYNKNYPLALEMANKHVKIHDNEASAYMERSAILRQLGQTDEADADLAKARSFGSNN